MKKNAFIFVVILFMFMGCGKKSKVVLKVGGEQMTLKDLEQRFQEAPVTLQGYLTTSAGKKQFMDLLLRERTIVEAAKSAKYDKRTDYKEAVANYKKEQKRRFEEYKESLLVELFVKDLHQKELTATDEDIEKYYKEHEAEYKKPLEITARHILVATKQEAEDALKRIKSGEKFEDVAREISIDPISASRGGEIGPFKKGDLVPEFESAVFPLKIGKVSGIVETQFGFHIIKKTAQKALPPVGLDEARSEIRRIIEKNKFDAWLELVKEKQGVEVDYNAVSEISVAPEPGEAMPEEPVQE